MSFRKGPQNEIIAEEVSPTARATTPKKSAPPAAAPDRPATATSTEAPPRPATATTTEAPAPSAATTAAEVPPRPAAATPETVAAATATANFEKYLRNLEAKLKTLKEGEKISVGNATITIKNGDYVHTSPTGEIVTFPK